MPPAVPERNPWYLQPFFGATPALPRDALRTIVLVSFGMFFENYDIGLLSAALPQIARDLGIAAEDSGYYLGAIRAGGLGTLFLVVLADRIGRRRIFLAAFVGMSLGTFASGLSPTPEAFAAIQFTTRIFMLTAAALALVILVEEVPAAHRGAAIGFFSTLGGSGFGLGVGLYALVDVIPFGWRALYALGLLPLALLPFFRRSVRETRRFARRAAHEDGARAPVRGLGAQIAASWLTPLRLLLRTHPGRAAAVGLAGLLAAMGSIAYMQYASFHLQESHGWSPAGYSAMILGGGIIPLFGNLLGGRGSDRYGRRWIGAGSLVLAPAFVGLFYLGPGLVPSLVAAWGIASLCLVSGDLVIRALTTELFPTSHRSTAAGWLIFVQTLGWMSGLFLLGLTTGRAADLAVAIAALSWSCAVAGACVLFVPETHRRELELTSDDRLPPPPAEGPSGLPAPAPGAEP